MLEIIVVASMVIWGVLIGILIGRYWQRKLDARQAIEFEIEWNRYRRSIIDSLTEQARGEEYVH